MAKRKKKIQVSAFLSIFYTLSAIYLIRAILYFNKIENNIRYTIVILISLSVVYTLYLIFIKKKKKTRKVLSVFFAIFTLINLFVGFNLTTIYNRLSNLNKKIVYSVTMVTLKENEKIFSNLDNLKNKKIGILDKDGNIELYNLSVSSINKNNINNNVIVDDYGSELDLIIDLLDKEVDVVFLSTNYSDSLTIDMLEKYEEPKKEIEKLVAITKVNAEKEVTKEEEKLNAKPVDINKPFTMLFFGVDSTAEKLSSANSLNGDSLMVATFNPKTMTMTMVSLPRDSYVYVPCKKGMTKLTHSAQNGTKCVINTIEGLLDVKIDYYFKINFRGVVKLVNEVGGIEVDVPYDVCEQDSLRRWGKYTVHVDKGKRVINGEQALALSRHRHNNPGLCSGKYITGAKSDYTRSAAQQLVIMGIIDKLKSYTSFTNFQGLLKILSDNLDTNMSTDTIFSYYDLFKNILLNSSNDKLFNIQRLSLVGSNQRIVDETTRGKSELSFEILGDKSLSAVKNAMRVNLGKAAKTPIKSFEYKYGENYIKSVIGNIYGSVKFPVLQDFKGKTEGYVKKFCNDNGLILNVKYVQDKTMANGIVLEQNYPENKRIDYVPEKTLTIKVVNNLINCLENVCKMPNFVGSKISKYTEWKSTISNQLKHNIEEEESELAEGTIISQSVEVGTLISEVIQNEHIITFKVAKKKAVEVVEP